MPGPARVCAGSAVDSAQPLQFRFDGRWMRGLEGDTLASALLANGVRLVARSFKYHRPRGVVTAGSEEPSALVDLILPRGREPNVLATTLRLREGLETVSQNRWPSLKLDALAINDLMARFLPAGFYYKTFMSPGWAWERVFEPLIRRAAGFGRVGADASAHTAALAETVHDHCDVLIVGGGAAGLTAAHVLGSAGLRVLLADQQRKLGGGTRVDARWQPWLESTCAALQRLPGVRCFPATTVVGAYGHGVFAAMQELSPAESATFAGLRERLRIIRAKRVLHATGATERLIAFPGNDRPGVMMAGAALQYLRLYGVAVGRRPAWFVNNDEAYESALALRDAGIECAGIIDIRADSRAAERARAAGIDVYAGAVVVDVAGRHGVSSVRIRTLSDARSFRLSTDCLLVSGGHSPSTALACQQGAALEWSEPTAAFVAKLAPESGQIAGAARGIHGIAGAARDGAAAARAMAAQLGAELRTPELDSASWPSDPQQAPVSALWEVPGARKSFVDLQNDVTTADVRLAAREGYEHVEHMKRYTTHGMGADQGRIGGLVGSAVLAAALGKPLQSVGQAKPRPYAQPVPLAVLAGAETGAHFKPKRRLPLHDWHAAAGASFVSLGLWLRPLVYSHESGWPAVLAEARHVRSAVGITDVSTLGKIDVQGADSAQFLDFIYANTFSTLPVGRARYGIMLREDSMLFDDGTTSRLGQRHFLVTTTTANAAAVLEHMEFQLQAHCPHLDVLLTDVSDQWAQFAVAGPHARSVLAPVVSGLELDNASFPFMAASVAHVAGIPGRIFRISFSGELAYELAVPANRATETWLAVLEAGKAHGIRPYGLDALNTLRIEKGHVTAAELNGNTNAVDLGFERMLKPRGDYVGRALAQRGGPAQAERLQLVGVRPADPALRLRNGAQLVTSTERGRSLGYL
ncbi:MAG: 2Fe-2S iron-sulfur cluster-binding protein, partial [Steroidobacteraceae bacterium]